jgi:hypothetical protein
VAILGKILVPFVAKVKNNPTDLAENKATCGFLGYCTAQGAIY